MAGISGHEPHYKGRSEDWITPKYIIDALGPFDLDPCASMTQPWECAHSSYTIDQDGLFREWFGVVWLNPPYGPYVERWIERLAIHNNGIALIFARTETKMFHRLVWKAASAIIFIEGRVRFYNPNGTIGKWTSGGPSVLISYGDECAERLRNSCLDGKYIELREHA